MGGTRRPERTGGARARPRTSGGRRRRQPPRTPASAAPATVRAQLSTLQRSYAPQSRTWNADPYRTLIGTILSQRTRDENTGRATRQLFAVYPDAAALAAADTAEVQRLIRPSGFYRVKAKAIQEVARLLLLRHGGAVPDTMEELLTLPGVGRKTANCVLCYGFDQPAIAVDTHVHRIANRLRWVRTTTPERTEEALYALVPPKGWKTLNDLLVTFGRTVCKPVGPRCLQCPIHDSCPWERKRVRPSAAADASVGGRGGRHDRRRLGRGQSLMGRPLVGRSLAVTGAPAPAGQGAPARGVDRAMGPKDDWGAATRPHPRQRTPDADPAWPRPATDGR